MKLLNRVIISGLFWLGLVLWTAGSVVAGEAEYRQCAPGEPCEIGEYLFDDSYTPNATASCSLSSRTPGGGVYLDEEVMDPHADGWYSLEISTTGLDFGLYRSQMCCTFAPEYLCIDKSFEIATASSTLSESQVTEAVWDATTTSHDTAGSFGENLQNSSSLTAADVWSYPSRSLSSFGTLIADIWSYSSRSLSSFGSLVSSIWSNSDRKLTSASLSSGAIAAQNDVTSQLIDVSKQVANNQYLLEQLVNAPIIETFIEESTEPPQDLQSKIRETKAISESLYQDTKNLKRQVTGLNSNWNSVTYQIALSEINTASRVLGTSTDTSDKPESIIPKIEWLKKGWRSPIITNLATQAASALANTSSISREIKSYGKTVISKQYLDIANEHLNKLGKVIGQVGDASTKETLFGYIQELQEINDSIIAYTSELDELLLKWNSYTPQAIDIKLARIKRNVLAINQIPDAESILDIRLNNPKPRENLALALKGVIQSNLLLLSQNADQVVKNTWLENGSIIFRSLVTNPSDTISQKVPIKYYLPREVKPDQIIKIDDWLSTSYDQEKEALLVSGEITLEPNQTKSFVIEVVDVWIIPEDEIASLRKQTQTLFEPLRNTSYFAQGSTIKADIEVNLDKTSLLQKNS